MLEDVERRFHTSAGDRSGGWLTAVGSVHYSIRREGCDCRTIKLLRIRELALPPVCARFPSLLAAVADQNVRLPQLRPSFPTSGSKFPSPLFSPHSLCNNAFHEYFSGQEASAQCCHLCSRRVVRVERYKATKPSLHAAVPEIRLRSCCRIRCLRLGDHD